MTTDAWGIDDGWTDTAGRWQAAAPTTIDAIRAVLGEPQGARPVRVVRPGAAPGLPPGSHIVTEDGSVLGPIDRVPADLPLGIHDVIGPDGARAESLLVSPGRCHLPTGLRAWGVVAQVPTTRSRHSWGVGDLADVRQLAAWLAREGAGMVGLSPIHAPSPVAPIDPSPYFPSSRRWRSPLLIRVNEVAGAASPAVAHLGSQARRLLEQPLVDRDASWALQRAALELIWRDAGEGERQRVQRWRAEQGLALEAWVRFCALAEVHGPSWPRWPAELRHPDGPGVEPATGPLADRLAFHAWLQLLVQDQLDAVRQVGIRVVQDLAIGVDPGGADAWRWRDVLAEGFSIGAPPDDFQPEGQRWGLPPWRPGTLRGLGYRPLAELLRAALLPGGGLRIDHVMGLSRAFWIPDGADPHEGAYVRFAGRELLDLVAMESARSGALVIGEDLGTVEADFRRELADSAILSTRLVVFEHDPPEQWPPQSLAMVTTHDLPTVGGLCSGHDSPAPMRENLERLAGPGPRSPAEVSVEVHRRLGSGASMLVAATMEDLVGVTERPNRPGTTQGDRPNWSVALPVPVDDLPAHDEARRTVAALASGRAIPAR